jgi:hypothetical protein
MGSVVSFTPRPLYPPRKRHGTVGIGGWMGPRAAIGGSGEETISNSY